MTSSESLISNRIKAIRIKRNLSQSELAEKIGVKQKDISRWENNIHSPSINCIIKLCNVLNISADYLLGIKDLNNDSNKQRQQNM